MKRPLFLEGEAGVGKTEIAKVLSKTLGRPLIRLQCYEGLDVTSAVYEWNYAAQMIEIRMDEATGLKDRGAIEKNVFSEKYLIRRPVLEALSGKPGAAPVFLIDELDRTDEAFEAFLLEVCPTSRSRFRSSAPSRPKSRRSSSSPPTAPAKSTTPSSAAAATTGSTIPTPSASWKSSAAKSPPQTSACPLKLCAMYRNCVEIELFKSPALPKR